MTEHQQQFTHRFAREFVVFDYQDIQFGRLALVFCRARTVER
ncbi:hypothetical protein [Caballeronia temeraria]|nr:hypothetical protein [Caballeronia temeraria]